MFKSILYKEWIKTRWFLAGLCLVVAVAVGFESLNMAKTVELYGAPVVWSTLLSRDTILLDRLKYLPLFAGGLLGVVQFIPEVVNKRLKLTLHLPYPRGRMILDMYAYGACALIALYALIALASALLFSEYVCAELVRRVSLTLLPWFLCGLAAYFLIVAACVEPTWRARALLLLLLAGFVRLCFISGTPEAYNGFLVPLTVMAHCCQFAIYHSVSRFKEGLQD